MPSFLFQNQTRKEGTSGKPPITLATRQGIVLDKQRPKSKAVPLHMERD